MGFFFKKPNRNIHMEWITYYSAGQFSFIASERQSTKPGHHTNKPQTKALTICSLIKCPHTFAAFIIRQTNENYHDAD